MLSYVLWLVLIITINSYASSRSIQKILSSSNIIDINLKRNGNNATPLILSCFNKQIKIIKYLLSNKHQNNINVFDTAMRAFKN